MKRLGQKPTTLIPLTEKRRQKTKPFLFLPPLSVLHRRDVCQDTALDATTSSFKPEENRTFLKTAPNPASDASHPANDLFQRHSAYTKSPPSPIPNLVLLHNAATSLTR